MNDDREHQFGGGDEPAPDDAENRAEAHAAHESADFPDSAEVEAASDDAAIPASQPEMEAPFPPRPFRSWASAREEENKPSLLSRIGARVASLFRRREADVAEVEPLAHDVTSAPAVAEDAQQLERAEEPAPAWEMPAPEIEAPAPELEASRPQPELVEPEAVVESGLEDQPIESLFGDEPPAVPVSPPDDYRFSWTRPDDHTEGAEPAASEVERIPPREPDFYEQPTELIPDPDPDPDPAPEPSKPGFFARLFGRKAPRAEAPAEQRFEPASSEDEPVIRTNEYPAADEAPFSMADEAPFSTADEAPLSTADEAPLSTADEAPVVEWDAAMTPEVASSRADEADPDNAATSVPELEDLSPAPVPSSRETVPWFDEPVDRTPFASVEDALPAADEPASIEPMAAALEAAAPEPKRGFFARLFGRKTTSTPEVKPPRDSLEIEIHEDRIEAAANALDAVGEQTFADKQAQSVPSAETFASVEEALPDADRETGGEGDERFAPPGRVLNFDTVEAPPPLFAEPGIGLEPASLPPDGRETVETVPESRPTMELTPDTRDTIEVVRESRDTIELTGDSIEPDARNTIELTKPAAAASALFGDTLEIPPATPAAADALFGDTIEIGPDRKQPADAAAYFGETQEVVPDRRESADSGAYFGDTLEPSHFGATIEEEKDTDEFEVVSPPPAEPAKEPLDGDTAEVSPRSLIERLLFWRAKKAEAGSPDAAPTVVEGNAVFLFSKFRTFYNEIIRFKHQKTEFTAGFSTAIVTDYAADLSPEGAADSLSKKLAAMLELQAAEAMWMGGESAERYPDAQYAMAALADETFLHTEWEGQGAWHKHLLEVKLFRTRAADVELFRRIDSLLKEQPNSAVARDLARVYLLVIAAGFRGKYRPFGLTRPLAEYRQRLYEYIHQGADALMLYAPDRRIFPEAAERTLVGEAVGRFSAAQRWAAILVFLVLGYTAIAHFAWSRVSADLKDVTDRIKASASASSTATSAANGSPGTP